MSRFIDADVFLKSVKQKAYPQSGIINESERKISLFGIMEILTAMPTEDVVEVVHGKWVLNDDQVYECKDCGYVPSFDGYTYFNYCPNCGAKMDLQ